MKKWKSFTIHTKTEAEDLIVDMLSELGISGAEVKDRQAVLQGDTLDFFKDVMPEQQTDDGLAEIVFYLDEDADSESLLSEVRAGLEDLSVFVDTGNLTIDEGETEDLDWVNNWKKHFHAFTVDDILIKPTWLPKPAEDHSRYMIEIDPGTAFGTGSHETTKLCIRALEKNIHGGETVLDVGTGSGILGIVALKEGASKVFGTDIDELAVEAAKENIVVNGIDLKDFEVIEGNIIDDEKVQAEAGYEKYDVCVANILADIIIMLQHMIWKQIRPGGIFICSGIINLKEAAVREALTANPHFEIIDTSYEGEWVSFTARKIG